MTLSILTSGSPNIGDLKGWKEGRSKLLFLCINAALKPTAMAATLPTSHNGVGDSSASARKTPIPIQPSQYRANKRDLSTKLTLLFPWTPPKSPKSSLKKFITKYKPYVRDDPKLKKAYKELKRDDERYKNTRDQIINKTMDLHIAIRLKENQQPPHYRYFYRPEAKMLKGIAPTYDYTKKEDCQNALNIFMNSKAFNPSENAIDWDALELIGFLVDKKLQSEGWTYKNDNISKTSPPDNYKVWMALYAYFDQILKKDSADLEILNFLCGLKVRNLETVRAKIVKTIKSTLEGFIEQHFTAEPESSNEPTPGLTRPEEKE